MNKEKKIPYILLAVICVMLIASLTLSTVTLISQKKSESLITQYMSVTEDIAQEDNVVIAGSFEILPTTQISDAYKSGATNGLSDADKETLDMASKILDKIIDDSMTDYEKEKKVYLWLTSKLKSTAEILTVVPDLEGEYYTPHDVLKNHSAVCVGYATTFRMFMQMLDIECMVVHDTELTHSWDLIKLDGDWYHTDCYMDSDMPNYANFNMNDTICSMGHDWNRDFFPAANGMKYNYAYECRVVLNDIYDLPQLLADTLEAGESVCSASFKKNPKTEEEQNAAAYMASRMAEAASGDDYDTSSSWIQDDKGNYIVIFQVNRYNSEEDYDVDEETKAKIDEMVEEVLGYGYEDYEDYEEETMKAIANADKYGEGKELETFAEG